MRSWIDLLSKETQNPFSDSFEFKNPILDFLKETHPKWLMNIYYFMNYLCRIIISVSHDEVAEWLRRWTANPMCSARMGSNPILVGSFKDVFWHGNLTM